MTPTLLTLLGFLAGVLAVAGVYSLVADLFLRDRARVSRRLDDEFRRHQRDEARKSPLFGDLAAAADEEFFVEDNPGLRRRFESLLEQSGLKLTARRLVTLMGALALGLGAAGGLLRQSVAVGAAAALVGAALPLLYVQRKRKARLARLLAQLPDALELMSRMIRAGQTMAQAMQAVVDEFDQPISGEFNYCNEQQNLGLLPEIALRDLARRTGLLEVRIFVLALMVQQQSGGNLAELLDKLAGVIRERFKIRGKIRTLTAEGGMQAAVLLALPAFLLLIISLLNWGYARVLFEHRSLLAGVLVSQAVGALWIRKIVNFDF